MKAKLDFCSTQHCLSRLHCSTCRNLEKGRNWRISLSKVYSLPDNILDFECQNGIAWGFVGKLDSIKPIEYPCSQCLNYDCELRGLSPCKRIKKIKEGFKCIGFISIKDK